MYWYISGLLHEQFRIKGYSVCIGIKRIGPDWRIIGEFIDKAYYIFFVIGPNGSLVLIKN